MKLLLTIWFTILFQNIIFTQSIIEPNIYPFISSKLDSLQNEVDRLKQVNNSKADFSSLSLDSTVVYDNNAYTNKFNKKAYYKYEYHHFGSRKQIVFNDQFKYSVSNFNILNQLESTYTLHKSPWHVDTIETIYTYYPNNVLKQIKHIDYGLTQAAIDEITETNFDTLGNVISEIIINDYDSVQIIYQKNEYEYNEFNNLKTSIFSSWNSIVNQLRLFSKVSYEYDINKNLILKNHEVWNIAFWKYYGKETFSYNSNNNIIEYVDWNIKDYPKSRWIYEYDSNYFLVKFEKFRNQSSKFEKYLFSWLNTGELLTTHYYQYKNPNWELDSYQINTYDSAKNLIEYTSMDVYPNDSVGYKITTQYDSLNNWKEKQYFEKDFGQWENPTFKTNILDYSIPTSFLINPTPSDLSHKQDSIKYYSYSSSNEPLLNMFEVNYYSGFPLQSENVMQTKNQCKVFPNPAFDNFTILAPKNTKGQIEIYSVNGDLIYTGFFNPTSNKIGISEFTKGLYIIRLKIANSLEVHKLIKL